MSYDTYNTIFIVAAILCGLMFVVSIILFFALKIPKVIGDLSGSTARKAIEDIRQQNADSGNKTYRSSAVNRERGKLTDKISQSGNLILNNSASIGGAMETEKIGTQRLEENTAGETMLLDDGPGETEVLSETYVTFVVEHEITYIHTEEIIESEKERDERR